MKILKFIGRILLVLGAMLLIITIIGMMLDVVGLIGGTLQENIRYIVKVSFKWMFFTYGLFIVGTILYYIYLLFTDN